jgi:uncharacterized protein (DUF4213/DUF364 family)
MKKPVFKRGPLALVREAFAAILFTLAVGVIIIAGLVQTAESNRADGLRLLDKSIRRAVVECYAIEGRYPDSVAYLQEHYGIIVDETKYVVHYEVFASNILPYIHVFDIREKST